MQHSTVRLSLTWVEGPHSNVGNRLYPQRYVAGDDDPGHLGWWGQGRVRCRCGGGEASHALDVGGKIWGRQETGPAGRCREVLMMSWAAPKRYGWEALFWGR
jgi:hypothetical protein